MVSGGQIGASAHLSWCPPRSARRSLSLQHWPWGLTQGPVQFSFRLSYLLCPSALPLPVQLVRPVCKGGHVLR